MSTPPKDTVRPAVSQICRPLRFETITWYHVTSAMPDEGMSCLVAIDNSDTDEVFQAALVGGAWKFESAAPPGPVYAWTYSPARPSQDPKLLAGAAPVPLVVMGGAS